MKAAPGIAGGVAGWFIAADGTGLTALGVAVVAAISCLFGMLSSASRVSSSHGPKAAKLLLMNAGAVAIAAMAIAVSVGGALAGSALIGLGVGLAGTKVLEVLEAGAITAAERISGRELVTREELDDLRGVIGDLRQNTQKSVSEQAMKGKAHDD